MAGTAKDYYDIPPEWIPSSNFANRPASEISEITLIDGVGTFVYLSGSSSSSTETVSVSTPKPQDAVESPTLGIITSPGPTITVSAPSEDDVSKARARSLSDDTRMLERPVMRKAATAPPGTLSLPEYKPQLPRRAISARPRRPKRAGENGPQQLRLMTGPFAMKKAGNENRAGPQEQLHIPPQLAKATDHKHAWKDAKLPGSFSEKARVRKPLDGKNLGLLKTDIMDDASGSLSPMSIIDTPRELYAIPEKHIIASAEMYSPSSPHAKDARRSIMSSLSGKTPPLHLNKNRLSKAMINDHINAMYLKGWRQVYLPGPISLEQHPAKLRKDSVASLEPFAKEVEPRGRRQSEMIILDSIAAFFDDFALTEEATEFCLDRYWLHTDRAPSSVAPDRKFSVTSVEETLLKSPEKPRSGSTLQASRFSFSSASSSSSLPRSGTPKRQRDKLKRLLSPAFPGSGWIRNPVDWGQQAET